MHNSPLSGSACLGFEYGYSQEAPETLVLWEAQFGDFVNTADVIVDQFKQRPLVIITPKLLLRLPQAASTIEDLAGETQFQPVLAELGIKDEQVTRLVLCTGKIYYDLVGHPDRPQHDGLAVGRVELLYPFPRARSWS